MRAEGENTIRSTVFTKQELPDELQRAERLETRSSAFAWSALFFAILQSVCSAVIAASGMRFAIGLAGLITSIATSAPAQGLHGDSIRLPMLIFSFIASAVNFGVLWQVHRLRSNPAAQWRVRPLSPHKKRMEQWQLIVSIVTVLLVIAELFAHKSVHGFYF